MTDEERREHELMLQRRRQDEDMAAVVRTPEGRRVLMSFLRRWGAGLPVGGTEAERTLRNEAEMLLAQIMQAAPQAGTEILQEIYGGR